MLEINRGWVRGIIMFRLMALLCGGIYVAMLTLGQDHGQMRFGLMQAAANQAEKAAQIAVAASDAARTVEDAAPEVTTSAVVAASFAPEQPLMAAPAASDAPKGAVFYVASDSANVREGPGKEHVVLERLPKGEAVLVLEAGEGPDGWSLILIEGDGVQGYIASRLLTP